MKHWLTTSATALTLEEMDEVFLRSKNIFDPPRIAREMAKERRGRADLEHVPEKNGVKADDEKFEDINSPESG